MSDLMNELCQPILPILKEKGVEVDELASLAYCFAIGIANPQMRRNTASKLHSEWNEKFDETRGVLLLTILLDEPTIMSVIIAFGDRVGHESRDIKRPATKFLNSSSESKIRLAKTSVTDFAKIIYPSVDWEKINNDE
ncbi:MAG: hypothetical protein E6R05_01405 [Candidatus Moraniibacteriota bacterium]|nr:MAG: hypothetical protein E6R05_01405 [Candidatus Moranbacteria bacterium]